MTTKKLPNRTASCCHTESPANITIRTLFSLHKQSMRSQTMEAGTPGSTTTSKSFPPSLSCECLATDNQSRLFWLFLIRFHKLVDEGKPFTAMDYIAPTPHWAVYGAKERGMDPAENRWYHNRTVRRAKVCSIVLILTVLYTCAFCSCSLRLICTQAGQLSKQILSEYLDDPAQQKHTMGSGEATPGFDEKTDSAAK